MSGKMRARLEAERRERIRLDQVRNTCKSIQKALLDQISTVSGKISQTIRSDLSKMMAEINDLTQKIQAAPDNSLIEINKYQDRLVAVIAQGRLKKEEWDDFQKEIEELKIKTQIQVESLKNLGLNLSNKKYEDLSGKFTALHAGNTTKEELLKIIEEVEAVRSEIENEEVRRETVKSIIEMFHGLGFTPSKPKMKDDNVTLLGKLPSGKLAHFSVNIEGSIEFDFEGYNGTACKDQLDTIQENLKIKFGMESEIEQFEWHNPDLLDKGSKDFPIGGQTRSRQA